MILILLGIWWGIACLFDFVVFIANFYALFCHKPAQIFCCHILVKHIYCLLWLEIIAILSFVALSLLSLLLYCYCYLVIGCPCHIEH